MVETNNDDLVETSSKGKVERLVKESIQYLESIRELAEKDFFAEGDRYRLEQIPGIENWDNLPKKELDDYLKGVGEYLGVDLVNIREEDVVRREFQEGVEGEKTEEGADVTVVRTKNEMFQVHVIQYTNPDLETRYEVVRVK